MDNEIVSTLLRQLSWSNNVIILSSTHSMEEKSIRGTQFRIWANELIKETNC